MTCWPSILEESARLSPQLPGLRSRAHNAEGGERHSVSRRGEEPEFAAEGEGGVKGLHGPL